MSDGFFRQNTADQDKKLDAEELVVGGLTVFRQRNLAFELPLALQVGLFGKVAGRSAMRWRIFGSRSKGWSSTSILGDAAEYLDTSQPRINAVNSATTYYIRSSSASDDGSPVGTGVRTVRIYCLDTAGSPTTITATLDGTTPVSIGSGISYFLWAEVATIGSNTVSVGNITISSNAVGAPAVSEIVEYIAAGGNRSLSGRVKVPTGYSGFLLDWGASAISATMDTRLRGDFLQDDISLSSGVFHFLDRMFLAAGGQDVSDLHYDPVPSGAEVKISAFPGGTPAGNKLECHFDILLIAQ